MKKRIRPLRQWDFHFLTSLPRNLESFVVQSCRNSIHSWRMSSSVLKSSKEGEAFDCTEGGGTSEFILFCHGDLAINWTAFDETPRTRFPFRKVVAATWFSAVAGSKGLSFKGNYTQYPHPDAMFILLHFLHCIIYNSKHNEAADQPFTSDTNNRKLS